MLAPEHRQPQDTFNKPHHCLPGSEVPQLPPLVEPQGSPRPGVLKASGRKNGAPCNLQQTRTQPPPPNAAGCSSLVLHSIPRPIHSSTRSNTSLRIVTHRAQHQALGNKPAQVMNEDSCVLGSVNTNLPATLPPSHHPSAKAPKARTLTSSSPLCILGPHLDSELTPPTLTGTGGLPVWTQAASPAWSACLPD